VIDPISSILSKAREKMAKVIYIVHVLSPDLREVGPDSSFWYKSVKFYREEPHWQDKFIVRGTWGAQIVEALKPREGEMNEEAARYPCRLFNFMDQSRSPALFGLRGWIDMLVRCVPLRGDDV
jgi:nicotinamidase-related amidase